MRVLALIFSVVGLLLLVVVADLRWRFVRLPLLGFESGLIAASLAFFAGLAASAVATLFAFLQLRRSRSVASSRWLLAWCCMLLLGFAVMFVV
jgi:hypothetical protein